MNHLIVNLYLATYENLFAAYDVLNKILKFYGFFTDPSIFRMFLTDTARGLSFIGVVSVFPGIINPVNDTTLLANLTISRVLFELGYF